MDDGQEVVPVLLADCSVFLGEQRLSRTSFRFPVPLRMLRGLVPAPNTMVFASWIEWSFAMPSALPTALALTSCSALLSYSLEKLVFSCSRCVIGEETK